MTPFRLLALLSLPASLLVMAAPAVAAEPASGAPSFGAHVSTCAQTMGFSGAHHPGMHRGAAGWDGMPC